LPSIGAEILLICLRLQAIRFSEFSSGADSKRAFAHECRCCLNSRAGKSFDGAPGDAAAPADNSTPVGNRTRQFRAHRSESSGGCVRRKTKTAAPKRRRPPFRKGPPFSAR
jgi:hypothetical protein